MSDPSSSDLFLIECSEFPPSARVAGFTGTEGLSQLYHLRIGVLTSGGEEIDLAKARGFKVSLKITGGAKPMVLHGMIARIALKHAWLGYALYQLELVPMVWATTLSHHSRVFVDMTVPEIVEQLLKDSGIGSDYYDFQLLNDYPKRFHIGQYKESRWNCISRLLEREGMYYFFDHSGDQEKLVITDQISAHSPSRDTGIRYVPMSGADDAMSAEALHSFTCEHAVMPLSIRVRDYDHLNPALQIFSDVDVWENSPAKRQHLGDGCMTEADAMLAAKVRADEWLTDAVVYRGFGRAFPIRSGFRFTVEEHPVSSMNNEFLAVEVKHHGRQAADELVANMLGLSYEDDYRFEVQAIVADQQFGPPRTTPTPRIYGLERGFVDGPADSDYAQIDEHGRYNVKMHFDIDDSDNWDGTASTWIRMLQPHAGIVEGMHFPLRKNTEVLVAHLGGDPDRPVIVGAVPTAVQPSPVTEENYSQNVLQTGGENRIEMEDYEEKQYIDISTPPKDTRIHLGEPHGEHSHYIVFNTEGNQFVNIGANRDIEIGGTLKEHVKGHVSWTHDSGRKDVVVGGVKENYTGIHDTFVKGTRVETVTSSVSESYQSQRTNVSGAVTQEYGSQKTTVGPVEQNYGSQTTDVKGPLMLGTGSTMWRNKATFDLMSGPVTIFTPQFKTVSPAEGWFGAISEWQWGKKAEFTALAVGATGVKIEAHGIALGVSGYAGFTAGTKDDKAGAKVGTQGSKAESGGLLSFLSGFCSLS